MDDDEENYIYSDDEEEYVYSDDEDNEMMDESFSSAAAASSSAAFDTSAAVDMGVEERKGGEIKAGEEVSGSPSSVSEMSRGLSRVADGSYRMLDVDDLEEAQNEVIMQVAGVLDVGRTVAAMLLREYRWNREKLFDKYYADGLEACTKAGCAQLLTAPEAEDAAQPPDPEERVTCPICYDSYALTEIQQGPCAHRFCVYCWEQYVKTKIEEGPSCYAMPCPEQKCAEYVNEDFVKRLHDTGLVDNDSYRKYRRHLLHSYVDINKNMKWCPAANCCKVALVNGSVFDIKCTEPNCNTSFCFKCDEEAHQPASCHSLLLWSDKCKNESETANWILANTKRCPECNTRIEKNQGCNHMTCRQCKHEFCWICMGPWSEHGAATGGYYKCNRFNAGDESKSDGDLNDAQRAKRELDRYLHHYQRYHNHEQSQKLARRQLESTDKRMVEMQEQNNGSSWIDVQFLRSAVEAMIDCRRVLKSTYIYGYYLEEDAPQKELFEHMQEMLEKNTEKLTELSELPLERMERSEVINFTRVTTKFRDNLLRSASDNFEEDFASAAGAP